MLRAVCCVASYCEHGYVQEVRPSSAVCGKRWLICLHRFGSDSISGQSKVKSSVARGIRNALIEQYPCMEGAFLELMPKKGAVVVIKWCT